MLSSYPNPFRTSAIIGFSLPKNSEASLEIFNLKGQKIRTLHSALLAKGEHSFAWDGKTDKGEPLPGGIYLCRLKGNGFSSVRKLTLMK
jgi:flagellar hook assembly protein FlgD